VTLPWSFKIYSPALSPPFLLQQQQLSSYDYQLSTTTAQLPVPAIYHYPPPTSKASLRTSVPLFSLILSLSASVIQSLLSELLWHRFSGSRRTVPTSKASLRTSVPTFSLILHRLHRSSRHTVEVTSLATFSLSLYHDSRHPIEVPH
jgi:hypothetical protein